ncbi:hypothetical protein BS47DRAFT_1347623 [Hydnum rufescens UP504]|uniref:Uncharacterized protein n=1 Tax=Hydnum rufescens UP504 TaxID=1448309 RepID=A0A9P6DQ29_9AGAM|nr:hypothetical protein BS47DRAFT_1347623 [Hydnum rufescens UP504]
MTIKLLVTSPFFSVHHQDNALPSYPVSPIEAALIPLGMISNSSCTLSPLIEWMIESWRTIDDRIGAVRHIELYSRTNFRRPSDFTFLVIGVENRRTIWNWLKIEMDDTDARGTVTFWNTRDGLHEGLQSGAKAHIEEDTLPVSTFARQFKDICVHPPNHLLAVLSAFFHSLTPIGFVMYDELMIAGGRRRSRVYI